MYTLITKATTIPDNFTGRLENSEGGKYWYKEGNLHREDGPAVEGADGDKYWFKEGREYSEAEFNKPICAGKVIEVDGKKYRLVPVS